MNKQQLNKAFDDITPTERQKKEMLNNILSRHGGAVNEKAYVKNASHTKYIYKFSAIAATFILVVGVVKMYPIIKDNLQGENDTASFVTKKTTSDLNEDTKQDISETETADENVIDNSNASKKDEISGNIQSDEKSNAKKTNGANVYNKSEEPETIQQQSNDLPNDTSVSDNVKSNDDTKTNDDLKSENELSVSAYSADIPLQSSNDAGDGLQDAAYGENDNSPNVKSSVGGGFQSKLKTSGIDCTKDEFLKRLGKNADAGFAVPSDMEDLTLQSNTFDTEQDIMLYGWVFDYYASYSRYITVSVSKNTDLYKDLTKEYEKQIKTVGGTEYIEIKDQDNNYTVYATDGSICYIANAYGVTQSEIKNLLNSILQTK